MAYRRTSFAPDEWYHCYNRGIDKRVVFETDLDYERFFEALYLSNSTATIARGNLKRFAHEKIMRLPRGEPIVDIVAYCMMPNHFHIVMRELVEGGISRFMHKVGTSYTMYFNAKRRRTGNLFVKPFRSKYLDDDIYFRRVIQYVHLNPAELFEHEWKHGNVDDMHNLEQQLRNFSFSSLHDYYGSVRNESAILGGSSNIIREILPDLKDLLEESRAYYTALVW